MELKIVIEIDNEENQLGVILEAFPVWMDDSYDDEFGTVKVEPYPFLESVPLWNASIYTHSENQAIAQYLIDNAKSIEEQFANLLREETIPDY